MNKTCARCQKTVYPIEELKCLDKIWHKGCFKCQECGMTLNMRTYKGYGKLPYCEAHIPKVKPTTMAETPELKRIAENTKIQSNVKYHEDFEKSKGKFTQVADDPETLRIKANSKIISNVAYHGDLEKKAAMERQRTINEDGEIIDSTDNYHIQLENYAAEMLPPAAPPPAVPANPAPAPVPVPTAQHSHYSSQSNNHKPNISYSNANDMQYTRQVQQQQQQQQTVRQSDYSNNYNNANNANVQHSYQSAPAPAQYNQSNNMLPNVHISSYASQNAPVSYDDYGKSDTDHNSHRNTAQVPLMQPYGTDPYYDARSGGHSNQRIGRIADYDPLSDGPRNSPMVPKHGATVVYSSGPPQQTVQSHQSAQHHQMQNYQHNNHNMQQQQQQQQQQHGHSGMQHGNMQNYNQNIQHLSHGMQHMNLQQQSQQQKVQHHANNGRIGGNQVSGQSGSRRIGSVADMDPVNDVYGSSAQQQHHAMGQSKGGAMGISGKIFIAMYDYEATDTDEVSFREGDLITNVSSIDEGWMTGRVERTGHTGMLPANYVELAQI